MSKETINIVKNFLNSYSIETTPNVYEKYGGFSEFLNKNHDVYITYLPDENSKNVIRTAKKLKLEGYDVIPHLPARTIVNKNDLEKYIGELANESGCSKMLIIGGGGNQAGEISSSIDVLKTDFLSKYNYQFVGVAGHPEGSPDISNENLDLAAIFETVLAHIDLNKRKVVNFSDEKVKHLQNVYLEQRKMIDIPFDIKLHIKDINE